MATKALGMRSCIAIASPRSGSLLRQKPLLPAVIRGYRSEPAVAENKLGRAQAALIPTRKRPDSDAASNAVGNHDGLFSIRTKVRPVNTRRASKWTCITIAITLLCHAAAADSRPVALGEIRILQKGEPDLKSRFKSALIKEFSTVHLPPSAERYILSVSLLRLSSETSRIGATSTCAVSAVLRKEGTGVLYARISGRARARQSQSRRRASEQLAMHGAVRSALSRVAMALADRN